jgi:hypothetical protein
MKQKEEIIARAKELDLQTQKYKEEQQRVMDEVTSKTEALNINSIKMKQEEEKLAKEKAEIERKQREI